MNKPSREALDAYYKQAETWSNDRQDELRTSRKVAWTVAAVAAAIALLEALALVLLTPLKTIEPYTLLVDRHTGFVQAVSPLDEQRISGDTALTQSFLVQYVVQREGFDIDSVQQSYRNVTLWSAENARADYIASMQASNAQSPLARYPRNAVVETQVKSVSPVARNVAMVRFDTRMRTPDGQSTPIGSWVAMIRYRFSGAPVRQEDRYTNPLGFQVVRYRRDQEAVAPPAGQPAGPIATPPVVVQPGLVVPAPAQRPPAQAAPPARPRPQPQQPETEL
jgi:type IV secretion system protein VirB8